MKVILDTEKKRVYTERGEKVSIKELNDMQGKPLAEYIDSIWKEAIKEGIKTGIRDAEKKTQTKGKKAEA